MKTILISGGTGLVGRGLSHILKEKGYRVILLSRSSATNHEFETSTWNIEKKEIESEVFESVDCIIHLAGANIGEARWTKERKNIILKSRIESSELIYNQLKIAKHKVKTFISASGIGYYGAIIDENIYKESDKPASDFLGETCKLWEAAAEQFSDLDIRVVKIRTGIVLSPKGGALEKMILPIKWGIRSALGSGKQYMPWIHIDDLSAIYLKAIEDDQMIGAYNAAAPEQLCNRDFIKTIAQVLKKPFWIFNVPALLLKLILGEMSVIILHGSRVSCEKIIKSRFQFKFEKLETALKDLLIQK